MWDPHDDVVYKSHQLALTIGQGLSVVANNQVSWYSRINSSMYSLSIHLSNAKVTIITFATLEMC